MRSYCLATLVAICLSCSVSGCSENPEEAKRKEVIQWVRKCPPAFGVERPSDWPTPYSSEEEWVNAGRKIEGIENTLSTLCEDNTTDIETTEIIGALSIFATADSVPLLISLAEDKNQSYSVRLDAVCALGRIAHPAATEPLCRIVSSSERGGDGLMLNAIAALGQIGDPNAIPAIENALKREEHNWVWEKKALTVLEELKQKRI